MLQTSKQLSMRAKVIIALACFVVVFAALVAIASVYDLQISQILTKGSLVPAADGAHGSYISASGFALVFEALGSCPIYLMVSVAGAIVFWFFARKKGALKILAAIGVVLVVGGIAYTIKDIVNYSSEFLGAQLAPDSALVKAARDASDSGHVLALGIVAALPFAACLLLAWQRISKETNDKMIWWAIAIVATVAFYLVPHFVKGPVGRVRFRTMNYLGDFSYYTPWYVANGKRVLTADGIVASTDATKAAAILSGDTCKSFPSGHTFSAGLVYTLLALPHVCDKCNKKWVKITLYCATVCYTGLVAVSRIVAGAHYMSDVLFGGTIAFVGAIVMREIFVCKGSHIKALFAKTQPAVEAVEAAPAEEAAEVKEESTEE